MGIFKKSFGDDIPLAKILRAYIYTDLYHNYHVSFINYSDKVNHHEYIRLFLHYYAKVLYNFDPLVESDIEAASYIKMTMDNLLSKQITSKEDILEIIQLPEIVHIIHEPVKSMRKIDIILYFVDSINRHIATDFPNSLVIQQIVISVFVLLQYIISLINNDCITTLMDSLKLMNTGYDEGYSYSNELYMKEIPTRAYLHSIDDPQ